MKATEDPGRLDSPLSDQLGPKVWARKDQLQHASTRGGLLCAMYPDTNGRADLEPLYDAATVRAMVEDAWCAGYYHDGYKNDGAYASAQAEATADEFLGPNVFVEQRPRAAMCK
jgi:hypothetical protein